MILKNMFKYFENSEAGGIKLINPKMLGCAVLLLQLLLATGCDTCTNPGGGSGSESEIFFTAMPENGTLPSIYSTFENGGRIRERLKNAKIFSAPARNGRIAALRFDTEENKFTLIIARESDGDTLKIEPNIVNIEPVYPVISPDGGKVAFYGSDNGDQYLFLHKINDAVTLTVTNYFDKQTITAFSDNGRYLAYIENIDSLFKLVVIDTELSSDFWRIYDKTFTDGLVKWRGETTIDFAGIDEKITVSDGYRIYHISPKDKTEEIFEIKQLGAFMPAKQPGKNQFAFSAINGNIFVYNPELTTFEDITGGDGSENNIYSQWSGDGKKLLCNRYFENDGKPNLSTLFIINVDTKKATVLSNNVDRGFWKPK